ncbi:hypothetical protein Tco_1249517 [Tanacetum coccineum]
MAASARASKLRCSLHSSLQLIWQPPQEPASSVVAFTAAYNLYGSLHRSQQAPLYPSQQLTTYMTASARVSKLCFNLLRSMTAFVAAYNLYGSLRKS